jgi:hypothetical protein
VFVFCVFSLLWWRAAAQRTQTAMKDAYTYTVSRWENNKSVDNREPSLLKKHEQTMNELRNELETQQRAP